MPSINIGAIFEENDSWVDELMNREKFIEVKPVTQQSSKEIETPETEFKEDPLIKTEQKKEINLTEAESSSTLPSPLIQTKTMKKSVSFGEAWNGSLATTKTILSNEFEETMLIPDGTIGRLLINCNDLFM